MTTTTTLLENQSKRWCHIWCLVFICSVLFRYLDNFDPKSAAFSSSRGSVSFFTGTTLVLAIVVFVLLSACSFRYATAP